MKLHYSTTSPFVRKVIAVAHETGLNERIARVTCATSPVNSNQALIDDNPLGKLPCLTTDDGQILYDSRVICEYLDTLHDGTKMFPESGTARWTALRRQAMGDGMLDAGVLTRYETFIRPESLRWDEWVKSQKLKFQRPLDVLENEVAEMQGIVDIGTLAIACALGYIDFRFPDEGWRSSRPQLAAWFEDFSQRPSLAQTIPQ